MKLFNVTPYLLLLEQENSNEETLSKANAEFVKEVYELQRAENDITIVLFQLQYLSCRLVILREHYRTAQKEHLICYSYIIGTLTYLEGMQAHCKFAYEIPAGADVSTVPAGPPPVIWTSEVINLIELLYACHELKLFNGGDVTLKRVVEHVCGLLGLDVKNASSYYARIRRRKADERTSSTACVKCCSNGWKKMTRNITIEGNPISGTNGIPCKP